MYTLKQRSTSIRRRSSIWPAGMKLMVACFFLFLLGACNAQTTAGTTSTSKPPAKGQTVWLTLHGYNYTDHYIDNYYVDGAWGGNLFLSDSGAGGGKEACCARWVIGRHLPVKVHVRWESGACWYTTHVDGEGFKHFKGFYTEEDVWLKGPVPDDPQYFETHIYPDGHVEVAITDIYSPPRLKLPKGKKGVRPGTKPWPKCTAKQLKQGED